MKLFVWEEVFCDYTCGLAVALAHDVDEAIKLLTVKYPWHENELRSVAPKIFDTNIAAPVAFSVSGGG